MDLEQDARADEALMRVIGESPFLKRIADKVAPNVDFARRGRLLVREGQLVLGPFKPVVAPRPWDWRANPAGNRSWLWRLNWLSFISQLIAYHAQSGDEHALTVAGQAVLDWLDKHPEPRKGSDHEFAWHDHGTALRAEQIALLAHYVEARGLWAAVGPSSARTRLTRACVTHAELLSRDSFFSRHTNHGLEQARVLALLGFVCQPALGRVAQAWIEAAVQRIEGELRHAFTDEGVHVENSPAYHVFVFKLFLGMVADYPRDRLGPIDDWLRSTGPKALEYLTRVIRPDGVLPIIGDTERLRVSDVYRSTFEGTPEYEHFLYVQSQGRKGQAPKGPHRVYPASGYAIFRSEWARQKSFVRSTHIVYKAGALSQYHQQQDDGSLVVYGEGEDWLIDSGMFNYEKTSAVRQYMRSRPAHNVAEVDRPARDLPPHERNWEVLAFSEDDFMPFVVSRHRGQEGVESTRRLSLHRRTSFKVVDSIVATNGETFDARLLWHVPADKEIRVDGRQVLITSTTSGRTLRLRIQGDAPDSIEIRRGMTGTHVHSVVSAMANQHEPSQVVVIAYRARAVMYVESDFNFEAAA
jgi:hypothetical protein